MKRKPRRKPEPMPILNINVNHKADPQLVCAIRELTQQLKFLGVNMTEEIARLTTEVSETKTVAASAVTLIRGIAQQIRDNVANKAALTALADDLDASTNELGSAVTENTPAEGT